MSALDTSVSIPALLSWHEHHDLCRRVAAGALIPSHVLVETYSVMTRLPSPHRVDGTTAHTLLSQRFRDDAVLVAPAALQRHVVARVAAVGLEGGSVYDALVGLTASEHGETLLTRDQRAARTYELLGVTFELVGP